MTTTALVPQPTTALDAGTLESVLLGGDLERLKPAERVAYMTRVCETLGLNPLTKPFEFIKLNGKLVMYARRECTEQLRKLHRVSIRIVGREMMGDDTYVVTAQATDGEGRVDESTGAVSVKGLSGESRANALMKAETKAKRRVTLSISGLGMLDESETPDPAPAGEQPATPLADFRASNDAWTAQTKEAAGPKGEGAASLPSVAESSMTGTPAATVAVHGAGIASDPKAPSAAPAASGTEPAASSIATSAPTAAEPATTGSALDAETAASADDRSPINFVECWIWKWASGKRPTKGQRISGEASEGEWVSRGSFEQRTKEQNAKLHALKAELGIEDAVWRSRLAANWNKESSADLSKEEASDLIDALEKRKGKYGTAADKEERKERNVIERGRDIGAHLDSLPSRTPGEEG